MKKIINIRQVITDKKPLLARLLPNFIFNYIKKKIHEDELNALLSDHSDKIGIDFVNSVLQDLSIDASIKGEDNINFNNKCLFVSNHPLGGLDSLALMRIVGKYHKNIKFLVNDILLGIKNLAPLFVPVNKLGVNSRETIKNIESTFQSDDTLLMFPAGLVSRKQKGEIIDLEWKKSCIAKCKQYKRDIIPVYISGKNSNFFYNFSNIRTKLKIKVNIEMFFLPDELFKQKNKTIKIYFGKPISYHIFDEKLTDIEWAQALKKHVYQLEKDHKRQFNTK